MKTTRSAPAPTMAYRTDIQGLRAIAVSAVVMYHAGVPFVTGGYVGVDVFFVISGFLITSHLLTSFRTNGRIHLANFYAKRARRILPAALTVVAVSIAGALIWYPPLLAKEVWLGAVTTALYVPNVLFALNGTNYLAETTPSLFQHYWSLGIEEQFYLVWPLFLVLGFFFAKRVRSLFLVTVGLVLASFTACVVLTYHQQPLAFFLLPTRAWELGVGGLVAFSLIYRKKATPTIISVIAGWLGAFGLIASFTMMSSSTVFPGFWAVVPVMSTALLIFSGSDTASGFLYTALSRKPMLFMGLISYSLYLVHWPLLQLTQAAVGFDHDLPLWATISLGAASVPLAWLSFKYVETPWLRPKKRGILKPRSSILLAVAGSAAVTILATSAYSYSGSLPLHAGQTAPPSGIDFASSPTSYVPSNLDPSLHSASSAQPVTYEDGCHLTFSEVEAKNCVYGDPSLPRITLFGDSHATQWLPALSAFAQRNGYSIVNQTKSSCPSVSANVLLNNVAYDECSLWRDKVIEDIRSSPPSLVILANYGSTSLDTGGATYEETWSQALAATIARIDSPVILIADTPQMRQSVPVCLSGNVFDVFKCATPRREALSAPARHAEESITKAMNVPLVDLTNQLCDEEWCWPIVKDTLVYRDAHHLTSQFSEKLLVPLEQELRAHTK